MTESLALLEAEFPMLLYGGTLVAGLLIGSFLNVVILRVPVMLERQWRMQSQEVLELPVDEPTTFNLIVPNSHCPKCEQEIKPWHNIPVISYLMLKGRCSGCGEPISLRYPMIEAFTAVLTVVTISHFGFNATGAATLLLTWALIALAMIDYDTHLLPDNITLPFLWLGIAGAAAGILSPLPHAVWGAIAGYLVLWFVFWGFKLITGKEGMGYGDFKLLAMLGAWLGWQSLPLIIILSSFAGAIIGGGLILFGRDRDKPIPFGPYLAIAGWITLIWGNTIVQAYLGTFA